MHGCHPSKAFFHLQWEEKMQLFDLVGDVYHEFINSILSSNPNAMLLHYLKQEDHGFPQKATVEYGKNLYCQDQKSHLHAKQDVECKGYV